MRNTASLLMTSAELEAFLASVNRAPVWVDLEAEPKIDRDNPPDLKDIADAAKPIVGKEGGEESPLGQMGPTSTSQAGTSCEKACLKSKAVKADFAKSQKQSSSGEKSESRQALDVSLVAERIISLLKSGGDESATRGDGEALTKVRADVVMELNALRNAAYSAGFNAAQGAIASSLYNYT
jgi:hypothetical protein